MRIIPNPFVKSLVCSVSPKLAYPRSCVTNVDCHSFSFCVGQQGRIETGIFSESSSSREAYFLYLNSWWHCSFLLVQLLPHQQAYQQVYQPLTIEPSNCRFIMALALCFLTSFFKLCLCLAIIGITVGQRIPDRQSLMIEELENLLINFGGANAAGMAIGVTPCTAYTDSTTGVETPNNPLGRQTAAQWIRTAFRKLHDFDMIKFFVLVYPLRGF